jgi:hypothetical protein
MMLDPSDRNQYHVMTALRGPDSGDHNLKLMTTAFLRHLCGVNPGVAYVHNLAGVKAFYDTTDAAEKTHLRVAVVDRNSHHMSHFRAGMDSVRFLLSGEPLSEYDSYLLWAGANLGFKIRR